MAQAPQSEHAGAWYPPPAQPPPGFSTRQPPTDREALTALFFAVGGILLLFPTFGVLALVMGAVAYFLGRPAIRRIDASQGRLAGRGVAQAATVLGVAIFALGAAWLLFWLILIFMAIGSQAR